MKKEIITMEKINSARIAGRMTRRDRIFQSGENHGETYYGTMAQWEEFIPADEGLARATGFYDWFRSDEREISWTEYRQEILSELQEIEA